MGTSDHGWPDRARGEAKRSGRYNAGMGAGWLLDLRFALRAWWRQPRFAAAAIAMLALAIAAVTTVFALAYAELWRPVPYPHSQQIVYLGSQIHDVAAGG